MTNLSQFIVIERSICRNYEDAKHGSPCLPNLGTIRMLQSVYGCDNKNKVN